MIPARGHHRYTYADYVAVELDSAIKHEFLDGEIYAMAAPRRSIPRSRPKYSGALETLSGPARAAFTRPI
ncbi:MAG TPA: hypothetical protein VHC69_19210 [Polyangiaceae bacterium]|nr:hypothetical protein [Polyangiaceae bacterium]